MMTLILHKVASVVMKAQQVQTSNWLSVTFTLEDGTSHEVVAFHSGSLRVETEPCSSDLSAPPAPPPPEAELSDQYQRDAIAEHAGMVIRERR